MLRRGQWGEGEKGPSIASGAACARFHAFHAAEKVPTKRRAGGSGLVPAVSLLFLSALPLVAVILKMLWCDWRPGHRKHARGRPAYSLPSFYRP